MKEYKGEEIIGQLDKRRGGYYFLKLHADIVNRFEHKRKTRFICTINDELEFRCGLNHFGDGNFFIIISTKNYKILNVSLGDYVSFHLKEDPNPLGEIPEALDVLLTQDIELKQRFDQLTDGKKRSIIIQVSKIKNIDTQISKSIALINNPNLGRKTNN
ncbi:DUF1905 domain-containing protein [Tenacibaculum agarivorans]|uniref:DUF1905 domain-containing protein n=1 Tax=Tenacibaculum agarivorans TaxID=1908389 RepID=UPI00094BAB57|nr:DUF1905 domain-containing protein [Tenacibaculum agarivorans]